MGEYATLNGEQIKIGTCEDMYYLRADQRHRVSPLHGNVDPASEDRFALRFRFPWPDEDQHEPGNFERYERAVPIYGVPAPTEIEHYSVQFTAAAGYNVCLPCPESGDAQSLKLIGLTVHRNGFSGAVQLTQHKMLRDGRIVPVLRCGGCGTKWRAEEPADIEALVVALRSEADRRADGRQFWHAVADRVAVGAAAERWGGAAVWTGRVCVVAGEPRQAVGEGRR